LPTVTFCGTRCGSGGISRLRPAAGRLVPASRASGGVEGRVCVYGAVCGLVLFGIHHLLCQRLIDHRRDAIDHKIVLHPFYAATRKYPQP
jgi:hypothetical protein